MYLLLAAHPHGAALQELTQAGLPQPSTPEPRLIARGELAAVVHDLENRRPNGQPPRWIWHRTQDWYPALLAAGVELERCHDLSLCGNILAFSRFAAHTEYARNADRAPLDDPLLPPKAPQPPPPPADQAALFEDPGNSPLPRYTAEELRAEYAAQQAALATVGQEENQRSRLQLLLAAESAGAMIAAEMQHAGVPWREDLHEQILAEHLGPRPPAGHRPAKLEVLNQELRRLLNSPTLNPDSPQDLMRALHRNGIEVKTTRKWELRESSHPAIAPLLAYKQLSRLHTANGWSWLDAWVAGGRFRPEYVVGGVVSGRWASRGGGALQIPRNIRGAVHADPGHKLIVADASQLEPRVLVALAQDSSMAEAARDQDLYAGIAAKGFGGDRAKAKVALLGAMYGATSGEAGRLMPQLARTYPRAVDYVEQAARAGESGGTVTTRLGRSSPPPSERWFQSQRSASAEEQRRAESIARSRGRFTRNFVVQGSAADWAACWLAELRRRLRALRKDLHLNAELVLFLHDEVMVHAPVEAVDACITAIEDAARAAKELLFGPIPVEFPVSVAVVDSYDHAK
ncbi:DNA polymerase I family protein with 3'-5'-exonuclease and polymerase domains [Pseudarthrobacter phenanthrenivorans Sphe3]|uniref:DNA-directed DNA polymerase n=1 Tax=Pseudarthrobacter phenanthrenivorans (strain DSM 18606 / JCM 16027 / LMG 23796 / Sphe3) TaxID=930171 RepID=F0M3C6_PSEPM|nr:bifunctional 3'-5' exonuclease/DNA polymerase [Pseudarthrobacter phenanthrenivorans]ADX74401.1 DNA polymerase I family protein with 3'-5'-exonuclease and polymerase domains [Pseudarthrobacter phenanthrenivorans Sphe3]